MDHHPLGPLLSCTQPLRLKCDLLGGVMIILELGYEIACTPWRSYTALSRDRSKRVFPSSHLDPYGFKMIVDMRSSLRDLQGNALQHFMACREEELIMENDSPHEKNAKVKNDRRH